MDIEEQSSNDMVITKLLHGASKRADGIGKPEFIVKLLPDYDLYVMNYKNMHLLRSEEFR